MCITFEVHISLYSERLNILFPVLLWLNLVTLTEQLNLWRYARSASQLPHPTTRASSPKESGQIWLRNERILIQISFIYSKWNCRQDTQPNRNTKGWNISREENLSQLFYCERYVGPVRQLWTHLVQHPPFFKKRTPGPQQLNVTIFYVKCKSKTNIYHCSESPLLFSISSEKRKKNFRFTSDWLSVRDEWQQLQSCIVKINESSQWLKQIWYWRINNCFILA